MPGMQPPRRPFNLLVQSEGVNKRRMYRTASSRGEDSDVTESVACQVLPFCQERPALSRPRLRVLTSVFR